MGGVSKEARHSIMKCQITHANGQSEIVDIHMASGSQEGMAPGAQFVLAAGFVALVWTVFLDWRAEKKQKKGAVE